MAFAGSTGDSLEVVCRSPCVVVFIDYSYILSRCSNTCNRHSLLVQNMLKLIADYIATDRGAMMRELKYLREEGIIRKMGRQLTIQQ